MPKDIVAHGFGPLPNYGYGEQISTLLCGLLLPNLPFPRTPVRRVAFSYDTPLPRHIQGAWQLDLTIVVFLLPRNGCTLGLHFE